MDFQGNASCSDPSSDIRNRNSHGPPATISAEKPSNFAGFSNSLSRSRVPSGRTMALVSKFEQATQTTPARSTSSGCSWNSEPKSVTSPIKKVVNEPVDMVLAIIQYQFAPFNRPRRHEGGFTLSDDPINWPEYGENLSNNIHDISLTSNGATDLIIAIIYSVVLEKTDVYYWQSVRKWACTFLFSMVGSPPSYLCWVQGFRRPEKTYFTNVKFTDGAAFLTIFKDETVKWIPYEEGMMLSGRVGDELPPIRLRYV